MEPNLSQETASRSTTQEVVNILWNPKAHFRVHKNPPLVPILSQMDLVHTTPSYFSEVHFNTINTIDSSQYVAKSN
jgi:hypothetical protein